MAKLEYNLEDLRINYLTKEQYNEALLKNEIQDNELYFTPDDGSIIADETLSATSTNAIQNKAVYAALQKKAPSDIIVVSSTKPTSATCKLWIQI